jgi:hypothetical protein
MTDLRLTQDILNIVQAEARAAAEDTKKALQKIKNELKKKKKKAKAAHQLTGKDTQEYKIAAHEFTKIRKTVMIALRELKGTRAQVNGQIYAFIALKGLASSMHNK